MSNETLTENIVYDHFKSDPLFSDKTVRLTLERQQSANPRIDELLIGYAKTGKHGKGKPDFILTFPTNSSYLIVIECKGSCSFHESTNPDKLENIRDYAVDGVLHYAKSLSRDFDVLAIAVSGETIEDLQVSHFLWRRNAKKYEEQINDKKLLSIQSYLKMFRNEHFSDMLLHINIIDKAIYLNELFHSYSIQENDRCTLVSAVLLALTSEPFRLSFKSQNTTEALANSMLSSVNEVLTQCEVRSIPQMLAEYSKLKTTVLFHDENIRNTKTKKSKKTLEVLKTEVIDYLYRNIYPLLSKEEKGFDILGKFYSEFIRYAGSQQSLGLVLTPQHITDLFCDLANLTKDDVLYDCCCGTGGFLIAGMKRMFQLAGNDVEKRKNIRQKQLCGAEVLPQMYTYACSNMMLRGDGKSNIYNGDCFNCVPYITTHKPTVAFLNPPYNVGCDGQMKFIEHALNMVAPQNGRVVAIVQMSCALKNEKELITVKKRILAKHHLKAVLSMPDDLFYPVGVVTCIMIFEANKPNKGLKSWFGYFKDDKFEKRKNQGRVDARGKYAEERKRWLNAYQNFDEIPGLSVRHEVTANDEWCAEAYMETDYSRLEISSFITKLRAYAAFRVLQSSPSEIFQFSNEPIYSTFVNYDLNNWKWFRYDEIFEIIRGESSYIQDMEQGLYPYVSATANNNGITNYFNLYNRNENIISLSYDGSVGEAFYQPNKTFISEKVVSISLRKHLLNPYIAMFLITLFSLEKYRFNYGLKWSVNSRMKGTKIKLPVTSDGQPDWEFMENYIKSLPYSRCL